jgi:redox-sensitive bicupin YhaK (pirin superfamily)
MPVSLFLQGHDKDLGGGFVVRRLLPDARQRSVGPFIFFDHFGPVQESRGVDHDVRPHPHIGLATVTYLFEGAMMHRDSLGSVQSIEPGAINWMTAGRGIVHSERKPELGSDSNFLTSGRGPGTFESAARLHGLQLWTALPLAQEECEPAFSHTPADAIPELAVGDARARVLVGEAFGVRSPVPALARTLYLDVRLAAGGRMELPPLEAQLAVHAVEGELQVDGDALPPRSMGVLQAGVPTQLVALSGARFVVIGGDPLDAPRHMWWNFVSSRKDRILQASEDWAAMRMGSVPGDPEFIPLPPTPFTAPEPRS